VRRCSWGRLTRLGVFGEGNGATLPHGGRKYRADGLAIGSGREIAHGRRHRFPPGPGPVEQRGDRSPGRQDRRQHIDTTAEATGANTGRSQLPGEGNKKIIKRTRRWQEKIPGTVTRGRNRSVYVRVSVHRRRNVARASPRAPTGNGATVSPGFPTMRDHLPKHWPDILAFAAVGFVWLGIIVYTL